MTIYAEYLFIENAAIGYILLYLTALLCAVRLKVVRLVLGAALCGLYAFVILVPGLHPLILAGSKVGMSVLIVWISFRERNLRALFTQAIVFFAVTVLLAGMCFFVFYAGAAEGLAGAGGFYIRSGSYAGVIIGVLLGCICVRQLWGHIRRRTVQNEAQAAITIYVKDNTYEMKGIVDTGNFLRDPVSGKPVVIVDRTRITADGGAEMQNRYRAVPYKTLGNESGMMDGMRADRIRISRGEDTVWQEEPVIALYEGKLFEGKEYGAIVDPSMLVKIGGSHD